MTFIALLTPQSLGQAKGFVEGIGFENYYRPDCWTPVVVNLTPETSKSDEFQLQLKQEDLDRDHPIFVKPIALTGNAEGGSVRQQKFRMYFRPQPTDGGLPDANDPSLNLKDLQNAVQVSLATSAGKWLAALPVTSTIINVDPRSGGFTERRGNRFILAVSDGRSAPAWRDYQQAIGMMEDVTVVTVQPVALPENVLGYDAVDGVLWLGADPAELRSGTDEKFRALESYVRRGGKLVICTSREWQKLLAFGDMLPVTIQGTRDRADPEPLRSMVRARARTLQGQAGVLDQLTERPPWENVRGPFTMALAAPKGNAIVEDWIDWSIDGTGASPTTAPTATAPARDATPWLVRRPFGAGGVTWVAQDLGDPNLTRQAVGGWPGIWDRVFDWKNDTRVITNSTPEILKNDYAPSGNAADIGASLLSGMELGSKSAWLITLAVVFFIGYWLVAGPGVYAYLATRRQTSLSWFAFGASAVVATALTVLLVRVTLRGEPQLRHISLVRSAAGEQNLVKSRFGLYIPRDGTQRVELKDMAPGTVAAISAFGIHPQYLIKAPDDPGPEYTVAIREPSTDEPVAINVPYRSTLKKFDADWTGTAAGRIDGSAKLLESRYIEGVLTNRTGHRLKNIYIAFKYPQASTAGGSDDFVLYLPRWENGAALDLQREVNFDSDGNRLGFANIDQHTPERGRKLFNSIRIFWGPYWLGRLRGGSFTDEKRDDWQQNVRTSIPVLSLFERIPPARNNRNEAPSRFELWRRGGRGYDVSAAVGAGALVVIAEADGPTPIPLPLEVEGENVTGQGSTVYQFVLPLDNYNAVAAARAGE
jgi:hypothetical protein